jgi:hypothetical protein
VGIALIAPLPQWMRLAYAVQVVRLRMTVNTLLLQIVCNRSSPKEVGL